MKNKVLVVAAHPDDELLGVGGTIVKHTKNKDEVYCIILGEGTTSRASKREKADKTKVDMLKKQAREAGKIIGFKEMFFEDLPDNRFDSIDLINIVKTVEKYIKKIKPDVVYTHHHGDLNIDHQLTFKAVLTACRPYNKYCPREVYTFETPSSTEWNVQTKKTTFFPNVYIDISKEIDKKISALRKYKSEMRNGNHPRSLKNIKILAQKRGSEARLKYAEAFYLVRKIKKG